MPTVKIEEKGCRGCSLCADVCPGDVFEIEAGTELARVLRPNDCIACFSCYYQCPSQCIEIGDAELQRPFYRIEQNVAFVEKFLQAKTATRTLTPEDWDEAYRDVAITLVSLARATAKMMGRGAKAIGRKSGTVSADHIPDIFEKKDLNEILSQLQGRFRYCFDFDFLLNNENVDMRFKPCALFRVVTDAGEQVGESMTCQLFHDYLAGIVSEYIGTNYRCTAKEKGESCRLELSPV